VDERKEIKIMMFKTRQFFVACTTVFMGGAVVPALSFATAPGWMVNGTELSGSEALATAAVDSEFVTTIAGVITITCAGSDLGGTGGAIESPNSGSATSVVFTGCHTAGGSCSLAGQNAGGTIGTLPVTSEVTLSVSPVIQSVIKPSGSLFSTIAFTGSKCSLSGTTPTKGEVLVEGPTGRTEQTLQLGSAVTTAASGDLKIGADAASLTGSALFQLANSETFSYL
jgi:hypothetical protein